MTYNDDEPFIVINEWDGVKILNAPKHTTITAELLLVNKSSSYIKVSAGLETVTFCDAVTYTIGDYDTLTKIFLLERVDA